MLIEIDFNSDEAIYIQLCNQIIMGIEDAFGIEIPASEAEKVTTVKEAVELIRRAEKG